MGRSFEPPSRLSRITYVTDNASFYCLLHLGGMSHVNVGSVHRGSSFLIHQQCCIAASCCRVYA